MNTLINRSDLWYVLSSCLQDNEYLHQSAEDDIILYNVEMNYATTIMTNSTMVCTFSINKKEAKCSCISRSSLKVSGLKPGSSNPYLKVFNRI